jgi:hypothetical protein
VGTGTPRGLLSPVPVSTYPSFSETRADERLPSSHLLVAATAPRPRNASSRTAARISVPIPRPWNSAPSHEPDPTTDVSRNAFAYSSWLPTSSTSAHTRRSRCHSSGDQVASRLS